MNLSCALRRMWIRGPRVECNGLKGSPKCSCTGAFTPNGKWAALGSGVGVERILPSGTEALPALVLTGVALSSWEEVLVKESLVPWVPSLLPPGPPAVL